MITYFYFLQKALRRAVPIFCVVVLTLQSSTTLAGANSKKTPTPDVTINQCLKLTPYTVQNMHIGNSAGGYSIHFEGRYQWIAIAIEIRMELVSKKNGDVIADVSVISPDDRPGDPEKFKKQKALRERYANAIVNSEIFSIKREDIEDMSVFSYTRRRTDDMGSKPIGATLVSAPKEMMFVEYRWKYISNKKYITDFEKERDRIMPRFMKCVRATFK